MSSPGLGQARSSVRILDLLRREEEKGWARAREREQEAEREAERQREREGGNDPARARAQEAGDSSALPHSSGPQPCEAPSSEAPASETPSREAPASEESPGVPLLKACSVRHRHRPSWLSKVPREELVAAAAHASQEGECNAGSLDAEERVRKVPGSPLGAHLLDGADSPASLGTVPGLIFETSACSRALQPRLAAPEAAAEGKASAVVAAEESPAAVAAAASATYGEGFAAGRSMAALGPGYNRALCRRTMSETAAGSSLPHAHQSVPLEAGAGSAVGEMRHVGPATCGDVAGASDDVASSFHIRPMALREEEEVLTSSSGEEVEVSSTSEKEEEEVDSYLRPALGAPRVASFRNGLPLRTPELQREGLDCGQEEEPTSPKAGHPDRGAELLHTTSRGCTSLPLNERKKLPMVPAFGNWEEDWTQQSLDNQGGPCAQSYSGAFQRVRNARQREQEGSQDWWQERGLEEFRRDLAAEDGEGHLEQGAMAGEEGEGARGVAPSTTVGGTLTPVAKRTTLSPRKVQGQELGAQDQEPQDSSAGTTSPRSPCPSLPQTPPRGPGPHGSPAEQALGTPECFSEPFAIHSIPESPLHCVLPLVGSRPRHTLGASKGSPTSPAASESQSQSSCTTSDSQGPIELPSPHTDIEGTAKEAQRGAGFAAKGPQDDTEAAARGPLPLASRGARPGSQSGRKVATASLLTGSGGPVEGVDAGSSRGSGAGSSGVDSEAGAVESKAPLEERGGKVRGTGSEQGDVGREQGDVGRRGAPKHGGTGAGLGARRAPHRAWHSMKLANPSEQGKSGRTAEDCTEPRAEKHKGQLPRLSAPAEAPSSPRDLGILRSLSRGASAVFRPRTAQAESGRRRITRMASSSEACPSSELEPERARESAAPRANKGRGAGRAKSAARGRAVEDEDVSRASTLGVDAHAKNTLSAAGRAQSLTQQQETKGQAHPRPIPWTLGEASVPTRGVEDGAPAENPGDAKDALLSRPSIAVTPQGSDGGGRTHRAPDPSRSVDEPGEAQAGSPCSSANPFPGAAALAPSQSLRAWASARQHRGPEEGTPSAPWRCPDAIEEGEASEAEASPLELGLHCAPYDYGALLEEFHDSRAEGAVVDHSFCLEVYKSQQGAAQGVPGLSHRRAPLEAPTSCKASPTPSAPAPTWNSQAGRTRGSQGSVPVHSSRSRGGVPPVPLSSAAPRARHRPGPSARMPRGTSRGLAALDVAKRMSSLGTDVLARSGLSLARSTRDEEPRPKQPLSGGKKGIEGSKKGAAPSKEPAGPAPSAKGPKAKGALREQGTTKYTLFSLAPSTGQRVRHKLF